MPIVRNAGEVESLEPRFKVITATKVQDGCDEWIGSLEDGRRIRAIVSDGVLEIRVANPIVGPQRQRYYPQHRGKNRTILVKVLECGVSTLRRLSYQALKAHTVGYITWPQREAAIVTD